MSRDGAAKTVVGIGELLWDLLPEGKQLGGAPANFAYHAAALGASGLLVSCVGADDLGAQALSLLEEHGLPGDYVSIDNKHATGTVSISLDDAGIPQYTIHENVAWDFVPETSALIDLAQKADAICFGSLAQRSPMTCKTIGHFLDGARPDCLKVYDINLRQSYYVPAIIRNSLDHADVLKLNDDELPVLKQMLELVGEDTEVLAQLLDIFSLQLVVLTKGAQGALMKTPAEEVHVAGLAPKSVADTVGAGDAFTAAITVGLLSGHELMKICDDANQLASYVCSQDGAMPPIPGTLLVP